jgi:hypothetical protein
MLAAARSGEPRSARFARPDRKTDGQETPASRERRVGKSSSEHGRGGAADPDVDTLKRDIEELKAEFAAALGQSRRAKAATQPDDTGARGESAPADAGVGAGEFTATLEAKIREHPFAAVGLAVLAGYLAASATRRS